MIGSLQSVTVVNVTRRIRMPGTVTSNGDGRSFEHDFVKNTTDGEEEFLIPGRLPVRQYDELETLA